jgi:tetratricopeptide (TPR) repeat protein
LRSRNLLLSFLLLLLLVSTLISAQTNNFVESWKLYELGKAELEDPDGPELGEALLFLQEAIDKRGGSFPEAEMAIGDIYFQEGAFALAKRQYEKAFELRGGMEIAEEKYTVLYRLADLHEIQELYADMDRYLQQILEDQPYLVDEQYRRFRDAFLSTYEEKGLDHLFKLYRMEGVDFSVPAHAKLGWFYYRTGRPLAILHSLFALDIMITVAVKELRRVQPEFVFTTMEEFLDSVLERDNIREYLVSGEFFKTLYYLATASYAASRPSLAEPIWRLLATYPLQGVGPAAVPYAELSARQLQSPWIDPYINPSVRRIEYPVQ